MVSSAPVSREAEEGHPLARAAFLHLLPSGSVGMDGGLSSRVEAGSIPAGGANTRRRLR